LPKQHSDLIVHSLAQK